MKFYLPQRKKIEEGQVLLITLLVVSVLLVVGLSVVSRSVTDVKISQQSQESARALWVAQAGLEEAIKSGNPVSSESQGITYTVTKGDLGGSLGYIYPKSLVANESATIWFVNHEDDGTIIPPSSSGTSFSISLGWSQSSGTAIEATVVYEEAGDFLIKRFAFDDTNRIPPTNFSAAGSGCTINGKSFVHCSNISLPAKTYFMRLRPMFNLNPEPVAISTVNQIIPLQGNCYDSTAIVKESSVQRKLQDCRLWPSTPEIFDYLLFSGQSLEQ